VLVRSDAQFDLEELRLIDFRGLGVGVGVALWTPARYELLFDPLMVVVFALGVGVGVGRAVRASFTLTALRPFALEVGVGVGVGLCCLYIFDLLLLRLVAFGFGVGVGCGPALAAPMLPTRAIAVMANAFGNVLLIFILTTC
jgi:hypothetical protein